MKKKDTCGMHLWDLYDNCGSSERRILLWRNTMSFFGLFDSRSTFEKFVDGSVDALTSDTAKLLYTTTGGAYIALLLTGNDNVVAPKVMEGLDWAGSLFSSKGESADDGALAQVAEEMAVWFPVLQETAMAVNGDLSAATKDQLREVAKAMKIPNYTKMKKDEMFLAIETFIDSRTDLVAGADHLAAMEGVPVVLQAEAA